MNLKNILKYLKLNESGMRMIVIFITILIVGQIFVVASKRNNVSITNSPIGDEKFQNIHTVKSGENLWKIAVQYFGDGFKWKHIADKNNLKETDGLNEGQKLIIPTASPQVSKTQSLTALPTASDVNNPANTSSTSTEAKTYTVVKGDTLWSIAESEYGSGYNWVDIKNANKLISANQIKEDQKLFFPNVNPKPETKTEAKINEITQNTAINGDNYIVAKSDNLWKIAVRAYGDGYKWAEIAKANSLNNPSLILPNQTLLIPR